MTPTNRRLTDQQVIHARQQVAAGATTVAALAREWGIPAGTLRLAVNGNNYGRLDDQAAPVKAASGERSRRLTEDDVLNARRQARDGIQIRNLAALLGVSFNGLLAAVRGETWAHLNDREAPVQGDRPPRAYAPARKLTARKVADARRAYASGTSLSALASRHGVGETTISAAVHGRTWADITDPPPVPPGMPGHRKRKR